MQDPMDAATQLDRCVRELGFCGALVNDHLKGHYLDEPRYDEVWAALEELSVPLYLHPGAPPADHWKVLDGRLELYGPPGAGPPKQADTRCASPTAECLTATCGPR